ncbi:hypothetical protein AAC387_Pa08g0492 [Persea americana]
MLGKIPNRNDKRGIDASFFFFFSSNLGVEEIGNLGIFSVFRLKTLRFQSSEEGFCRASSLRTKEGKKGKSLKQG